MNRWANHFLAEIKCACFGKTLPLAILIYICVTPSNATINNTVTVYGTAAGGPVNGITATADETVDVIDADPRLVIDKQAGLSDTNGNGFADAGEVITYTFDVTNGGNVTIRNVTVGDTTNATDGPVTPANEIIFNDVAPASDSYDAASNESWDVLAPGDTVRFSASYTVTQSDVDMLQ